MKGRRAAPPPIDRRDLIDVDPRLRAALRHAPDADLQPPPALSDTIVREARAAVRTPEPPPRMRRWLDALLGPRGRMPWATGVAGALVAMVAVLIWWDRPLPEPDAESSREPQTPAHAVPGDATTVLRDARAPRSEAAPEADAATPASASPPPPVAEAQGPAPRGASIRPGTPAPPERAGTAPPAPAQMQAQRPAPRSPAREAEARADPEPGRPATAPGSPGDAPGSPGPSERRPATNAVPAPAPDRRDTPAPGRMSGAAASPGDAPRAAAPADAQRAAKSEAPDRRRGAPSLAPALPEVMRRAADASGWRVWPAGSARPREFDSAARGWLERLDEAAAGRWQPRNAPLPDPAAADRWFDGTSALRARSTVTADGVWWYEEGDPATSWFAPLTPQQQARLGRP